MMPSHAMWTLQGLAALQVTLQTFSHSPADRFQAGIWVPRQPPQQHPQQYQSRAAKPSPDRGKQRQCTASST